MIFFPANDANDLIVSSSDVAPSTMACFGFAVMHAVPHIPVSNARIRWPFETTRVSADHARQPSALAGIFSRRVNPHALRHTEHSIWVDQTRRHGRALDDTRAPRRWAMTPSNESIPSEGEAIRQAYVPRRCVLPSSSLVYDFSCHIFCGERAEQLTILRRKLKQHSESSKSDDRAERWIKKARTPHSCEMSKTHSPAPLSLPVSGT